VGNPRSEERGGRCTEGLRSVGTTIVLKAESDLATGKLSEEGGGLAIERSKTGGKYQVQMENKPTRKELGKKKKFSYSSKRGETWPNGNGAKKVEGGNGLTYNKSITPRHQSKEILTSNENLQKKERDWNHGQGGKISKGNQKRSDMQ